ncbi:MAG TPA: DUF4365 domain-containing protein [Chthoniobacterales bacterium]|nr:DUF4365 domain-containing protein [Chthoniobacterales bacterium]
MFGVLMGAKRSNQPTVGPSFVIEQRAIEVLKSLLPDSWLWRAQVPDFFVDYNVEIVEAGELTGLQLGVQVKGSHSVTIRKGGIRFRMNRKPLLYYRDDARLPVFIALVDVTERNAYWVFAQKYLREHAAAARLDSQNTLSVTFNLADSFRDLARFSEAVKQAEQYVRDLYPGSIGAAIEQRKTTLQKLDPTIGVDVSFQAGREVIDLHPTAPLCLTFTSGDSETRRQFLAMVKRGDVFLADMDLIGPHDSPLIQTLMPAGRYKLRFEPESRPGSVQLRWKNSKFLQIEGYWQGGIEVMRFGGRLPHSPLSVEISLTRGATDEFSISVSTPLRLDEWEGQALSCLAWFDELRSLAATLATEEEVELAYFVEGLRVGRGQLAATNNDANQRMHRELDWFGRVRSVAEHYGIDPRVPKPSDITYQTERELDALWALTRGDSFQDFISGATFGCTVESETALPAQWRTGEPQPHGMMKIIGTAAFDLFGYLIEIPDVENTMTDVELISFEDTDRPLKKRLNFRAGENAIWSRRKLGP